jgi:hypothetical protein
MKLRPAGDFLAAVDVLAGSRDVEVVKFAEEVRRLYPRSSGVPNAVDVEDLATSVAALFPTPFARTFEVWRTNPRAELLRVDTADEELLASKLNSFFGDLWSCWLQIVHFLPFVLMAPLTRLSDELQKKAGKKLAQAFVDYDAYYRLAYAAKETDRNKFERLQCDLLEHLIDLCSDLASSPPLPTPFFFNALLAESNDFRAIFPNRFTAHLRLLQSARNRVFHGRIASRPAAIAQAVYDVVEPAFLDSVSIMVPLAGAYGLYCVEEIDQTANTLSFSGATVRPASFNIADGGAGRASNDAFLPRHIYVIDRRRELARDPGASALEPQDYTDLTPFIVEKGRLDDSTIARERRIYALDEYRSADRSPFISFADLASHALQRLPVSDAPTEYERRELSDLLEEIDRFTAVVEKLDDYIRIRRKSGTDFPAVRQSAWKISKRQLQSIVDVQTVAYDGGNVPATGDVALCSYDPELYVAPREAADIAAFFASTKRGILLVGGSGFGKTTLLASTFLERLQAGDIALFLSGRWLSKVSLAEILVDATSTMGQNWTPVDLDSFVRDENAVRRSEPKPRPPTQVSIFIDAVNEYTVGTGAPGLLEEIIDFVNDGGQKQFQKKLQNVRIVASCRSETWAGFRGSPQSLLDTDAFYCTADGDPVTVGGFDDERTRQALYQKYQLRYGLSNSPYDKLPPPVSDLFRSPLMLGLVAETYGTTVRGEMGQKIPRNLNYYAVFSDLRRRKIADCQFLVPNKARRETIAVELEECLAAFSSVLYARMTAAKNPRDYVGVEQTARKPMTKFSADRRDRQVTAFRALREVGIIASKGVSETDEYGDEREGRAFAFFHDRYAEYELARVYQAAVLGPLTQGANREASAVEKLAQSIERLVSLATGFPVLSGALEHWFQMNLRVNKGNVSVLIPLCDRLSRSESGSVRSRNSEILTGFALRGSVPARELYKIAFASGGRSLSIDLATTLGEAWPGITGDVAREFIEACDPERDELALETFADVFAEHANCERKDTDGGSAVAFVAQVCPSLAGFVGLVVRDRNRLKSYVKFMLRFCLMTIVTCAERPWIVSELRDFLVDRFRVITGFIVGKQAGNPIVDVPKDKLRDILREQFERILFGVWEDGISCDGVNDTFFVDDGSGVVQRDIMLEYIPFMCAVHNRDFRTLSLADDSPFMKLTIKMLGYRRLSILGFAAYASVTIAIGDDHEALRRIVLELVTQDGSEAGRFVAINIVEAYTEVYPSFAREALAIATNEMLPTVLDDVADLPHFIVCAAGAVETNIPENWQYLVPILDAAFAHVAARADRDEMLRFGKELRCMTFFGDSRIGTRFVDYLLGAGYLSEDSEWRPAALEICAGMLAGHRADLLNLFAQYGIPDATLFEAEALRNQAVLDQQRTFGSRARWNLFFVRALAYNTKLRYLLIKYMFCSVALGNSVTEWAKQMGTFMIEAIRAYTADDDDPQQYARLSIDDVYASTPMRPVPGDGKRYVPRRRAATK